MVGHALVTCTSKLVVGSERRLSSHWRAGIRYLYVHVVADNISARKLYEKAGFEYESEESVKEARSLGRPRRYILRTHLV